MNEEAKAFLNSLPFIPSLGLIRAANKFCNSGTFGKLDTFYMFAQESETARLINWANPKLSNQKK